MLQGLQLTCRGASGDNPDRMSQRWFIACLVAFAGLALAALIWWRVSYARYQAEETLREIDRDRRLLNLPPRKPRE